MTLALVRVEPSALFIFVYLGHFPVFGTWDGTIMRLPIYLLYFYVAMSKNVDRYRRSLLRYGEVWGNACKTHK